MTFPFKQAWSYTRGGRNPAKVYADVNHMAQGGGTVSWLSRTDGAQGNNSSTLVIEYSGRVVQMVRAGDMDHSLHVKQDPDDRDASDFGIYSLDVAEAVLAPAGVGELTNFERVLPYIVSIEWEGYAADGPNPKQIAAYLNDVKPWLKATFPNIRGHLGHRDFQDYKVCPGGKFPWAQIGGHGLVKETSDMPGTAFDFRPDTKLGTVTVKDGGHWYRELATGALKGPLDPERFGTHVAIGPVNLVPPIPGGDADDDRTTGVIVGGRSAALLWSDVNFTPAPAGITQDQLEAAVAAAVSADRAKARITYE